jgi:membrane protease subunit HflK
MFPVQRSREQFERFLVPAFTVLMFLLQGGGAFFLWRWLSRSTTIIPLTQPMVAMSLFGVFALVLFLLGRFSVTIARLENHRLLRPGASYLLLGAYLSFITTLAMAGVILEFPKADFYVARGLCIMLALVAGETLVALVLELYRPRVKGRIGRPLYESRLVGLFAQPEGLITTAAQALDYQFGFKVSETWFYRFFEKALCWLILLQLGVLLLSTCFVFIESGEQGLLERFGRPVDGRAVLDPGAHLKWPWPIDQVYRYRTGQIQAFDVGYTPEAGRANEKIILWTVAHAKEENFLVANREPAAGETAARAGGRKTPPISLLTVSIPVQFQIRDLKAWVYHHQDAAGLLRDLATREVVRYLVSVDLNEIMSFGRLEAGRLLRDRIQAAATANHLGADILFVGLQDIHPPVTVAGDYEKVISAGQLKQAKILAARADSIRTNVLAEAQATNLLNLARAERKSREAGALARAALFTNQIPAFNAAPSVYAQRAYLQTFARAVAGARKYVLLVTNTQDVVIFDLQDQIRADLLNLSVPPPKK